MSGKRRKFTPEFRAHSVRLVTETGRPVAHVAAEIGIGAQLLGRWVAKEKSDAGCDNKLVLDDDERAELNRLREENAELRSDRAFLKKPPRPGTKPGRRALDGGARRSGRRKACRRGSPAEATLPPLFEAPSGRRPRPGACDGSGERRRRGPGRVLRSGRHATVRAGVRTGRGLAA